MGELMTITDIAPRLKHSETTIRRLIHAGAMPCRKSGRRYFFTEQDINEYLEKSKINGQEVFNNEDSC